MNSVVVCARRSAKNKELQMALKKSSRIALQALKNDFIQMFVAERMGEERPPRVRDHLFISRSHSQNFGPTI